MSPLVQLARSIPAAAMLAGCVAAQTLRVESAQSIEALIARGALRPGAEIIWADGEYSDVELDLEGADGTRARPITLRAGTPGGVVLRGESKFRIGTRWWVVRGFHFDGRAGGANSYNPVQLRSDGGRGAEHVRLTDCALTDLTVDDSSSKWVLIYGRHNAIERCSFRGKRSRGALVTVELGALDPTAGAHHRIERCYFGDFEPRDGTDNETIRVGYSGDQAKAAHCVIRRNYFVRCSGENEIISNKSSFNRYVANTFRQCDGALVLRHGHHCRVEGNHFFGDGASDSGGIRISGSHHVVVNNYLEGLTGKHWNAALSILGGEQRSGGSGNGYQQVDGIVIAHNSILGCARSIYLNDAKGARAPTGLIANNLVSSASAPLVLDAISSERLEWVANLLHGAPVGAPVEAATADPLLRRRGALLRPSPDGPAVDAADGARGAVATDVEGQTRPATGRDLGADEVVGARGPAVNEPLTPADVGATFVRGRGPARERAGDAGRDG